MSTTIEMILGMVLAFGETLEYIYPTIPNWKQFKSMHHLESLFSNSMRPF
jgi:hypothetical protein